jgi:hypothetical protein
LAANFANKRELFSLFWDEAVFLESFSCSEPRQQTRSALKFASFASIRGQAVPGLGLGLSAKICSEKEGWQPVQSPVPKTG